MTAWKVDTAVGNVTNDSPELIEPLGLICYAADSALFADAWPCLLQRREQWRLRRCGERRGQRLEQRGFPSSCSARDPLEVGLPGEVNAGVQGVEGPVQMRVRTREVTSGNMPCLRERRSATRWLLSPEEARSWNQREGLFARTCHARCRALRIGGAAKAHCSLQENSAWSRPRRWSQSQSSAARKQPHPR